MSIITISGKKRSGKTTISNFIVENKNTYAYQLAKPIKNFLFQSYNDLNMVNRSNQILTESDFEGLGIDRESPLLLSNLDVFELIEQCLSYCSANGLSGTRQEPKLKEIKAHIMSNQSFWSIRRLMQLLGTDVVVNHFDQNFWLKLMMETYFDVYDKYEYFLITDVRQDHEFIFLKKLNAIMLYIKRDNIISTDGHITENVIHRDEILIENNGSIEELKDKVNQILENL